MKKLMIHWAALTLIFYDSPCAGCEVEIYDFSDQVIDGEIKKPTALYTNARQKVKFDRLLSLKKSFIKEIEESSKKVFK